MHATRTAIAAAVVATAVMFAAACSRDASPRGALPPDEAAALLDKRIWLDKEPRSQGEVFHVLVFDRQSSSGVLQHRTIWKGDFELFKYEAQKGQMKLVLPGSSKRMQTGFTVERAKRGDADVKLTLEKTPRGPTVYYGYRFDGHDADAWLAETFGK